MRLTLLSVASAAVLLVNPAGGQAQYIDHSDNVGTPPSARDLSVLDQGTSELPEVGHDVSEESAEDRNERPRDAAEGSGPSPETPGEERADLIRRLATDGDPKPIGPDIDTGPEAIEAQANDGTTGAETSGPNGDTGPAGSATGRGVDLPDAQDPGAELFGAGAEEPQPEAALTPEAEITGEDLTRTEGTSGTAIPTASTGKASDMAAREAQDARNENVVAGGLRPDNEEMRFASADAQLADDAAVFEAMTLGQLRGADLVDDEGATIGKIEDVALMATGTAYGMVVNTDSGLLDFTGRMVMVPEQMIKPVDDMPRTWRLSLGLVTMSELPSVERDGEAWRVRAE